MATKRKDKSRVVLKTGEVQRKDGTYQFSWQDSQMKRRFVYARTLDDLREKEKRIQKDKCDGIIFRDISERGLQYLFHHRQSLYLYSFIVPPKVLNLSIY